MPMLYMFLYSSGFLLWQMLMFKGQTFGRTLMAYTYVIEQGGLPVTSHAIVGAKFVQLMVSLVLHMLLLHWPIHYTWYQLKTCGWAMVDFSVRVYIIATAYFCHMDLARILLADGKYAVPIYVR